MILPFSHNLADTPKARLELGTTGKNNSVFNPHSYMPPFGINSIDETSRDASGGDKNIATTKVAKTVEF